MMQTTCLPPDAGLTQLRQELRQPVNLVKKDSKQLLEAVVEGAAAETFRHCLSEIHRAALELHTLLDEPFVSRENDGAAVPQQNYHAQFRHDLLNPVNVIRGYCEFLQEEVSLAQPQEMARGLQRIQTVAEECLMLLRKKDT